jgi:GNAT acetyltransferase-like protein
MERREAVMIWRAGEWNAPPGADEAAGEVRPLTDGDVPQVVQLYERVFPSRGPLGAQPAGEYLREILCRNPWRDDALPSLVYEERGGRIAGCLGVMPRRMLLDGRPIQAAISHTFMVEPGSRSSLAALALARTFLSGGQDLSIAEGGSPSLRILERFGGTTSLLYSLRWTRPLRPSRYVLSILKRRGLPAAVSWGLAPVCSAVDALAPLVLGEGARLPRPRRAGEDLTTDDLLEGLSRVSADQSLRPAYDRMSLAWLLDLLAGKKGRGVLQRVAVRDASGDLIGWYIYYLNPGGISEVVQIGASKASVDEVLEHLFHHARRGGAVAVSGQLDPAAFRALASKGSVLHHDGLSWFLVHSRDPAVLAAIHRADAFLTRLEGEWCIGP